MRIFLFCRMNRGKKLVALALTKSQITPSIINEINRCEHIGELEFSTYQLKKLGHSFTSIWHSPSKTVPLNFP